MSLQLSRMQFPHTGLSFQLALCLPLQLPLAIPLGFAQTALPSSGSGPSGPIVPGSIQVFLSSTCALFSLAAVCQLFELLAWLYSHSPPPCNALDVPAIWTHFYSNGLNNKLHTMPHIWQSIPPLVKLSHVCH